ncbi:unnamed protein product [Thlaspi arvense]|uniref:Large ribosomal subunit protein bL25 beta domain-containing protein n=1 Tax=Thlaspi arvense TaxID=13288 RepID=A0AAU9T5M9_THLAR|nr:unnamed protein product [Thlaspi arvense]
MLLRRVTTLPKTLQNLRSFSPAATALAIDHPLETQLDYLPGFPRPDPKYAETILAVPRSDSGKSISAKERKAGRIHLHSGTDAPLNVTFIRAPPGALLKVDIPLVFIGDDVSPGLKKGASLNTIKRTVKFLCPAEIIPPYIEVDLSQLDVGQKLVMGDLKVHPALKLIKPKDEPIVKIAGGRVTDPKK